MAKVIIGAGPAGLYLAIKLHKAGIRDLVVYDPRASHYTRPGHLNASVFDVAQKGLDLSFWPENTKGHIKDLEKALYTEAKKRNIRIETKTFVRLHQDAKKPGVVVQNNSEEEIVTADYVFDCSGGKRVVIAAVNQVIPGSMVTQPFVDLPVPNHFLAYVKIPPQEWTEFQAARTLIDVYPDIVDPLTQARSIIKVRALGWKEFSYPRCYGSDFGKNKICLYLQTPDNLAPENYTQWVQATLECYLKSIHFEQLPPSNKPRFGPFKTGSMALDKMAFKGKNLPTVIAVGDAQIDFDSALAHGIKNGMQRIDTLLDNMELFDHEIQYFDAEEFQSSVTSQLREHKQAVIDAADKVRKKFSDDLVSAQSRFRQALSLSTIPEERQAISNLLNEINARQSHIQAVKLFAECHNQTNQLVIPATNLNDLVSKLTQIHGELLKAYNDLPALFATETQDVQRLLLHLAVSWKELGNALTKTKDRSAAISTYRKALEIYELNCFIGKHAAKELPIYSNLVIVCNQEGLYSEAIQAGDTALAIFDGCSAEDQPKGLQEKVLCNQVKALCAQSKLCMGKNKQSDAEECHDKARCLVENHRNQFGGSQLTLVLQIVDTLQQELMKSKTGNVAAVGQSLGMFGLFDPASGAQPNNGSALSLSANQ